MAKGDKHIGGGSSSKDGLVRIDMRPCFGVMNPLFGANTFGITNQELSESFTEPSVCKAPAGPSKRYIATTKLIMLTIKVLKWLGN